MFGLEKTLSSGDIIGAFVPEYLQTGAPREFLKNTLVLGLEIDPRNKTIEGVYTCRLSERTNVVRPWDFPLNPCMIDRNGAVSENAFVLRTCRIDLLPYTEDFFGPELFVYGKVSPEHLEEIVLKINEGQRSRFYKESWGPRPKLETTVVSNSVWSAESFSDLDLKSLFETQSANPQKPVMTATTFSAQFELAMQQLKEQTTTARANAPMRLSCKT